MKKQKLILFILPLLTFIGTIDVYGVAPQPGPVPKPCGCEDNLCTNCPNIVSALFTICNKMSKNCTTIDTNTINNNQKYDLFEIKDKEIYLNNSEINLEFNNIWSLLDYKIHISGTNKIHYLDSFNRGKNSGSVQEYPNLYTSDYIPFTVEGDGTLEIEVANQIKKNTNGEKYYKCWKVEKIFCGYNDTVNRSTDTNVDVKLLVNKEPGIRVISCLTEAEINTSDNTITFTVPKYGYTVTDIKNKFAENADAFYNAQVNLTMTMQEFNNINNNTTKLLKSYARANDDVLTADGRRQFIDTLVENGKSLNGKFLGCNTPYLTPTDEVIEEAQITAAWGLENIKTDLRRSFSNDGHYLINFPEEKNMITTTKKDNIVFESTEEFDPNYHLVVDDITEKITDIQSASVQAKTDKTLVELYDIYMADENDNIVKMENGTYKIKVELNDLLRKYEGYEIIYISEDNKVELIDAKVEDNYIVFNTTHLSKYGVVGKEIKKTGNIITNPQTADSVVTYGLIFASLAIAITLVMLRIKKLKNN